MRVAAQLAHILYWRKVLHMWIFTGTNFTSLFALWTSFLDSKGNLEEFADLSLEVCIAKHGMHAKLICS